MGVVSRSTQVPTAADINAVLVAERDGLPFVHYRDGDGIQHLLTLGDQRVTIGREFDNDLVLDWDREASRLHALLERLGGSWTVVDDGMSRNGTFVNGVRVRGRRRLGDGDEVRIGTTVVSFRDPVVGAEETPLATAATAAATVTPGQRRVLIALCKPLLEPGAVGAVPPSNAEIAGELTVSVEAVRTHLKTLFRLFEVPDLPQNRKRAELARRALASGVVLAQDL